MWTGRVGDRQAGQGLGGLLLDPNVFGLRWRVISLLNVPVGLVAMAFGLRWLGVPGSLALVLVPLILGRDAGWPVWT